MEKRGFIRRRGFWPLALLWLPAGIMATAAARFMPSAAAPDASGMWVMTLLMAAGSLVVVAPCGLPLALGCRRLWCLGYRRAAWTAGIGLGAVTVAASLVAGLLGPLAIAVYAASSACRCGSRGGGWRAGSERGRRRVDGVELPPDGIAVCQGGGAV